MSRPSEPPSPGPTAKYNGRTPIRIDVPPSTTPTTITIPPQSEPAVVIIAPAPSPTRSERANGRSKHRQKNIPATPAPSRSRKPKSVADIFSEENVKNVLRAVKEELRRRDNE